MPTLRSQYQHVRNDISKCLKNTVGGETSSETMVASVQSCLPINTHTSGKETYLSPSKSMVNVSSSSSEEETALLNMKKDSEDMNYVQSSARSSVSPPGSGRKSVGSRSRRSSRNSTGSRRSQDSSRRSSGSLSEDILNTATVHTTQTTNEAPLYTTSSLPTLHNQGLVYSNSFASYKHLAENAIMQSLQVPSKLSMDGLCNLYPSEENLLYLDQHLLQSHQHQQYIPLLMKTRAESQHMQDSSIPRNVEMKNGDVYGSREVNHTDSGISRHDLNGMSGRRQDADLNSMASRWKQQQDMLCVSTGQDMMMAAGRQSLQLGSTTNYSHAMTSSARLNPRCSVMTTSSSASMGQLSCTAAAQVRQEMCGMSASTSLSSLTSAGSVGSIVRQQRDLQGQSRQNEYSNSLQNCRGMETSSSMSSLVSEPYEEACVVRTGDEGLYSFLDRHDCFETKEGLHKRAGIVKRLDTLVKQWVRSCGLEQGLDYTILESNQGMVLTYGSCKLEAADQDADMDLICIAPSFVDADDFFGKLFLSLKKHNCVRDLRKLPEVFVPVIKFRFNDIEIDFTFSQLQLPVPENEEELLEEKYTRHLDDRCLRSLNGYRATCEILTLVPNIRVFQLSLCAVKLWGRINGVYGNILGYLGGASWAILVAKICQEQAQMKGEHTARQVIFTFFQMYSQWRWPTPVFIREVVSQPLGAWDPSINSQDRDHSMPIITSSVPQMNSAVNISRSVQRYIQERMHYAHQTCIQIQHGKAEWDALFKPFEFYKEYEHYIKITGSCEHDSSFWFGCLESKLRHFKEKIELSPRIHSIRIWPKGYTRSTARDSTLWDSQTWFIGFVGSSNQVESLIYEDFHTLKERCYSDLKRSFGQSHLVQRAFNVSMDLVQRSDIFKFLTLRELNMYSMDGKNKNYSSLAEEITIQTSSSAATHSVQSSLSGGSSVSQAGATHFSGGTAGVLPGVGQVPSLAGSVYPHNILSLFQQNGSSTTSSLTSHYSAQQPIFALPGVFPYYSLGHMYPPPPENLSPPIVGQKGRQHSPRPVSSPRHLGGHRTHSPVPGFTAPTHRIHSPTQQAHFIYPEGISAVGHHFVHSPKLIHPHPYSPKQTGADPSVQQLGMLHNQGPFLFPPPIPHTVVSTPPPATTSAGPNQVQPGARTGETPSANMRLMPGIHRRGYVTTVVTGVTSINNNKGQSGCSCQSVSDIEPEKSKRLPTKTKDRELVNSTSEDERLRSISNSSDTVPPSSVYRSRINQQDSLPPSPTPRISPARTAANNYKKMTDPIVETDTSVPPPIKPGQADTASIKSEPDGNTSFPSFSSLNGEEKAVKRRAPRSPRLSISELNDAPTLVPIQMQHHNRTNIMVNFYNCNGDDVFTK